MNKYKTITQNESVIKNPNVYVGEQKKQKKKVAIYNENKIVFQMINYRESVLKMFDEILANAVDSFIDGKTTKIKINIEKNAITIKNSSDTDLIELKKDIDDVYWPTKLFHTLNTSSNYDKQRDGLGVFGIGAKIVNMFSTTFKVKIQNKKNYFEQTWKNYVPNDPIIDKKKTSTQSYVEITFKPNMLDDNESLNESPYIYLFLKRVYDSSIFINAPIFFNGISVKIDFNLYCSLYTELTPFFVYDDNVLSYKFYCAKNNNLGSILLINGMYIDNGKMIIKREIFSQIIKKYNEKIKMPTLLKHIFCIIKQNGTNIIFSDLLKTKYSGKLFELPTEFYNQLSKLKSVISQDLIPKQTQKIMLNDIIKFDETTAKNKQDAYLVITEGDSAKSSAISGIYDQRHKYAVFCIKGKFINVTNDNCQTNVELKQLLVIIGIDKPRYKGIIIMTDQDYDGYHIRCLLLNFIISSFQDFLNNLELFIFRTPIITITNKGTFDSEFFNLDRFNKIAHRYKSSNYEIFYNKGIGSHEKDQMRKFFHPNTISDYLIKIKTPTPDDVKLLRCVFDKDHANIRKQWMSFKHTHKTLEKKASISEIINNELHLFSIYSLDRAIPNCYDGCKSSQRKIIYHMLMHKIYSYKKMVSLISDVVKECDYMHSIESLYNTAIELAREFTNNLPLCKGKGAFGDFRDLRGASPRYISYSLQDYTKYIYNEQDTTSLERKISDDIEIEPRFLVPIIPMILINTNKGIATGWKSELPSFNPLDIIEIYINERENDQTNLTLKPWYRNDYSSILISNSDYLYIQKWKMFIIAEYYKHKTIPNRYLITSLPRYITITAYKKFLQKYINSGSIKCEETSTESPWIIIDVIDETINDNILNKLKLYVVITPKCNTLGDFMSNEIIQEHSIHDILTKFADFRLRYYEIRKNNILNKYAEQLKKKSAVLKFIELKLENKIIIENKKNEEIIQSLQENNFEDIYNDKYNYFLNLPIRSLTHEQYEKIKNEIKTLLKNIEETKEKAVRTMWKEELLILKDHLLKIKYGHTIEKIIPDSKIWEYQKISFKKDS